MSNTTQDSSAESEKRSKRSIGRSTPLGNPTQRMLTGMRRRTELGFLLFLQYQARLSPGQWAYLLSLQRKCNLNEIDSAIELFKKLSGSQRASARAEKDLRKILARTPSLPPKSIRREQRRIGVGYRDKGTLRLLHQDHQVQPRTWWMEDIVPFHLSGSQWVIPETLLTEEDLALGGIHLEGVRVGGHWTFSTVQGSRLTSTIWRFPKSTLTMSEELEKRLEILTG